MKKTDEQKKEKRTWIENERETFNYPSTHPSPPIQLDSLIHAATKLYCRSSGMTFHRGDVHEIF